MRFQAFFILATATTMTLAMPISDMTSEQTSDVSTNSTHGIPSHHTAVHHGNYNGSDADVDAANADPDNGKSGYGNDDTFMISDDSQTTLQRRAEIPGIVDDALASSATKVLDNAGGSFAEAVPDSEVAKLAEGTVDDLGSGITSARVGTEGDAEVAKLAQPAGLSEGAAADDVEGVVSKNVEGAAADDVEGTATNNVEGAAADDVEGTATNNVEGSAADDVEGAAVKNVEGSAADDVEGAAAKNADDYAESVATTATKPSFKERTSKFISDTRNRVKGVAFKAQNGAKNLAAKAKGKNVAAGTEGAATGNVVDNVADDAAESVAGKAVDGVADNAAGKAIDDTADNTAAGAAANAEKGAVDAENGAANGAETAPSRWQKAKTALSNPKAKIGMVGVAGAAGLAGVTTGGVALADERANNKNGTSSA